PQLTVSRETLHALAEHHGLAPEVAERFERLLEALSGEPDPPTTIRDLVRALDFHLADSLSGLEVEELRRARRAVDIGSGAGFPGLALAIALPRAALDLVESRQRSCELI